MERLLGKLGIAWSDVIAVGDDSHNIELFRLWGVLSIAVFWITQMARRHTECHGLITGLLLLGAGVLVTLLFFDFPVYFPAVLIVSVSDTLSALVDRKYGNHHVLGMHNRTLEGSFAFFLSALVILLLTCPARVALSVTFFVSLIELYPFYNLDNLLVPVETALFLKFARGMLKKTSLLDITRGERSFYYFYGKIKLDKYLETATNADSEIASPNISSSYPCIQPQREIHASIETHRRFHHVHYCSTPTKCKLS